ncbi:hypothetical protein BN890_19820 [Bacteroides xylanisolvens SD CC 1b]|uniref:Uncharacterized protein n=1 Tax=Bacteroides xylanisolvens SD CC 1b TaxID=702447 RepID=D4VPH2_9BACE|nr:conserved domain protein [Bacteroides xylanisolvens SD CC 1b]CDM04407.1 hypothetical protein BN890_19820 [Bacteroides xylanisolvens SD CC 1b]
MVIDSKRCGNEVNSYNYNSKKTSVNILNYTYPYEKKYS